MQRLLRAFLKSSVFALLLAACGAEWEITNPYEEVDWSNDGRYKGNLHTHTTLSDGSLNPQTVVDTYHELGYRILAITDHNRVSYPWTAFSNMEPRGRYKEWGLTRLERGMITPQALVNENRNASVLDMISVRAIELTHHNHMNSFFSTYEGDGSIESHTGTGRETESLNAVAADGGLMIWNHPMALLQREKVSQLTADTIGWYVDLYHRFSHLIGQEVNNNRFDHILWDSTLARMMPGRTAWGFSNDDMHTLAHVGRRWNVFLLPELSKEWVRRAMIEGRFFFAYADEGHDGPTPPRIDSISVNPHAGSIRIHASDYESVEWMSSGGVVHEHHEINLNDLPDLKGYVRAVFYGKDRKTYIGTQPFGFRRFGSDEGAPGRTRRQAPETVRVSDVDRTAIAAGRANEMTQGEAGPPFTPGPNVTDIDGNVYRTIKLGNREWMAENLKVTQYRDGTPLSNPGADDPAWTSNSTGAYAWYNNDEAGFKESYGALYNWHAVDNAAGLCPAGWRVLTDDDWKELEKRLGMSEDEANSAGWRGSARGVALKLMSAPAAPDARRSLDSLMPEGTTTNGFAANYGGYRSTTWASYADMGRSGYWWTATDRNEELAWIRILERNFPDLTRFALGKRHGFSVRCVKE